MQRFFRVVCFDARVFQPESWRFTLFHDRISLCCFNGNIEAKLTLENVILDGGKDAFHDNGSPLACVGGGVFVDDDGVSAMLGGEITGNEANTGDQTIRLTLQTPTNYVVANFPAAMDILPGASAAFDVQTMPGFPGGSNHPQKTLTFP